MSNRLKILGAAALATLIAMPALAQVGDRTIRFSVGLTEDHPQSQALRKFAELVDKKSNGKMKVRGYYNNSLGTDAQAVAALRAGTQEMCSPSTSPMVSIIKEYAVFDFPFLFNNEKEADAILDGPFGDLMLKKLEEKDLVGLTWWENGFRNLTNSRRAIQSADDIKGIKLRVMQNPVYLESFNTLGATAVAMPFSEVFPALESRAIDAQENPLVTIQASKFNEVQKFLTLSRHSYTPFLVLISKKYWDGLTADEKAILKSAADESKSFQRTLNREADAKTLADLKSKGMQVSELKPADLDRMRQQVKPVVDKYTKDVGEDLVKQLYAELEKVRKAN